MNVRERPTLLRRAARRLGRALFRWAENNDDPRAEHNGERWWLGELLKDHVRRHGRGAPFVLIDAGANRGDYTHLCLELARAAGCAVEVHVFEPSPACVAGLQARFAREAVQIAAAALSDHDGEAVLHGGKEGSSQASLLARVDHPFAAELGVAVPLRRLDGYVRARGLGRIDLLKLDVEGAELAALQGAGEALNPATITAIQFEYGGTTLDARVSLRDIYHLLESRGYRVAKLLPAGVDVRHYAPWMEHFAYANYVALPPRWSGPATSQP